MGVVAFVVALSLLALVAWRPDVMLLVAAAFPWVDWVAAGRWAVLEGLGRCVLASFRAAAAGMCDHSSPVGALDRPDRANPHYWPW